MQNLILRIKKIYNIIFRPDGIFAFSDNLPEDARVLDVGCGNNSPYIFKTLWPRFFYVGLDIGDYNQFRPNISDRYILTTPEEFPSAIRKVGEFDAVISSHNIEHVNDREQTLLAMMQSVKIGGVLFLAFPTEDSVNFPTRNRTLNYFDDSSHQDLPPPFDWVLSQLEKNGFVVVKKHKKYRPFLLCVLGWAQEPFAKIFKTNFQGTWAYYGFESIIWAKRI